MCQVCQDDSRTARPISETTCLRTFGGYGACLNPKGHDGDCTDANGYTFTGDIRQSEKISVVSPDDEDMIDAPIFEGRLSESTERLIPGTYVAWVIATEEYGILRITENRHGDRFARMTLREAAKPSVIDDAHEEALYMESIYGNLAGRVHTSYQA